MKEKMRTKDRLYRVYNKIVDRLGEKYDIGIRIYSNIYILLKSHSIRTRRSYNHLLDYYDKYLNKLTKDKKLDYIKSKHSMRTEKNNRKREVFRIVALATKPISIVSDAFKRESNKTIAFYLLHEIAHNVMPIYNERKCDLYAIRWIRTLTKEGILK